MTQLSAKPEVTHGQDQLTKISAYDAFIAKEGIPNHTGFAIADDAVDPLIQAIESRRLGKPGCSGESLAK